MSHHETERFNEQRKESLEELGMKTYKDFEDFLQEKFIENNPSVLDDDIPDAFSDWLADLDVQELIDYGNAYAKVCNPS